MINTIRCYYIALEKVLEKIKYENVLNILFCNDNCAANYLKEGYYTIIYKGENKFGNDRINIICS